MNSPAFIKIIEDSGTARRDQLFGTVVDQMSLYAFAILAAQSGNPDAFLAEFLSETRRACLSSQAEAAKSQGLDQEQIDFVCGIAQDDLAEVCSDVRAVIKRILEIEP